ncbi:MAG: hypothetical protein ABI670_20520 [Chloroflexota bacterium]
MIVLQKVEAPVLMGQDLEEEWRRALERYNTALARKTEVDRIYVAAATQLNTIERLVKKVEKRQELARREQARAFARQS